MICSDERDAAGSDPSRFTPEQLLAQGWQRGFVADEPRLGEAVETYIELGFEVVLLPYTGEGPECSECLAREPDRCKVIYIRRRD